MPTVLGMLGGMAGLGVVEVLAHSRKAKPLDGRMLVPTDRRILLTVPPAAALASASSFRRF